MLLSSSLLFLSSLLNSCQSNLKTNCLMQCVTLFYFVWNFCPPSRVWNFTRPRAGGIPCVGSRQLFSCLQPRCPTWRGTYVRYDIWILNHYCNKASPNKTKPLHSHAWELRMKFDVIFSLHTTFSGDMQFISRLVRLVKHLVPASVLDPLKVLGAATPLCVICQQNISHLSLPIFLSSFLSPSLHPYPSMAISMASSASSHLTSSMRKMANRTKPRQHW